jgi:hypothetical protein
MLAMRSWIKKAISDGAPEVEKILSQLRDQENEGVRLLLVIDAIVFQQAPRQFAIQACRKCNGNRLLRFGYHHGR